MGEQNVLVVMTNGTNDPLKAELAVLTAFALRKNGHKATMLMMGEAGSVIDDDILRNCNGFGLPPMAKILDDDCMKDVEWLVWQFCADARKKDISVMKRKGKFMNAIDGAAVMAAADKVIAY